VSVALVFRLLSLACHIVFESWAAIALGLAIYAHPNVHLRIDTLARRFFRGRFVRAKVDSGIQQILGRLYKAFCVAEGLIAC
jgi:hypothetical protein